MGLEECLKTNVQPGLKIALLGVGSTLRSDDAAGMYFIELIGKLLHRKDLLLIAGSTAPENFTGVIKKFAPDKLFIIDAAYMGLAPGESRVVPAAEISGISFSTHMLPLTVMLKYLETEAPCDVIFIGIQPKYTDQALPMSDVVKKGTERLVDKFYWALVKDFTVSQ